MNRNTPTLRCRALADRLRTVLAATDLDQKAIAAKLRRSPNYVSRLLTGQLEPDEVEVAAFMAACGVGGSELHSVLALCRGHNDADLLVFSDAHHWARFVVHVWQANKFAEVAGAVIPWLLQTKNYTRAVIAQTTTATTNRVDRWSTVHERSAGMLTSGLGPLMEFFVPEWVLWTPVGGTEVMSEQLHHLLRVSFWPRVALWVLPAATSTPVGLGGGFTLLEFAKIRPVVHREAETMSVVAMDEVEVDACRAVVERLRAAACDERRSRELISQVAFELYGADQAQPDACDQGDVT